MKSIREFSTRGMDLWERERLFNQTAPIPIGEIVYRSGDAWECTECVKVTEENQKEISMFWNSIYFDTFEAAERQTNMSHAAYGRYLNSVFNY